MIGKTDRWRMPSRYYQVAITITVFKPFDDFFLSVFSKRLLFSTSRWSPAVDFLCVISFTICFAISSPCHLSVQVVQYRFCSVLLKLIGFDYVGLNWLQMIRGKERRLRDLRVLVLPESTRIHWISTFFLDLHIEAQRWAPNVLHSFPKLAILILLIGLESKIFDQTGIQANDSVKHRWLSIGNRNPLPIRGSHLLH